MAKSRDDFVDYYYDVDADSYEPEFKVASSAKQLRTLRKRTDWTNRKERLKLLRELRPLIVAWEGRLPTNLRDVFRNDEVDWLLVESVDSYDDPTETRSLIDFVCSTGYKDRPRIDEETGKPRARRTTAIHHAARRGWSFPKKYIRKLFAIYDRFDVDYVDERTGLTHFQVAYEYRCDDVVEKFLELGGWQNPSGLWRDTGDSLLLAALKRRDKRMAEVLLRRGADPNAVDAWGNTALCYAAFHGCGDSMALLAARDADPNLANVYGSTPLHIICKRNDVDLADRFLKMNEKRRRTVRVNAQNNEGNAPLHLALSHTDDYSHVELARLLLRRGAHPNLANAEGTTPLHCAFRNGVDDVVHMLFAICDELDQPVRIDTRDKLGRTPLYLALDLYDYEESIEFLLSQGADPNVANNVGNTSLHMICSFYDTVLLSKCFRIGDQLNRPLRVDAQDERGQTPLHSALYYGNRDTAELLLRRGASTNLADAKGLTPLHYICNSTRYEQELAVTFFEVNDELNRVVQLDVPDKEGKTPLYTAGLRDRKDLLELLLRRGADPNLANDHDGSRPLHVICYRDQRRIDSLVRSFFEICDELNRPVSIDAPDELGRTPLQWAVMGCSPKAVDALLDRDVDPSEFVFPTEAQFSDARPNVDSSAVERLTQASVTLAIVERLVERGYQLDRGEATKIMNALVRYELVEKVSGKGDLDEAWRRAKTRETGLVAAGTSVHDLYRLRPEEARKWFTYENCHEYAWTLEWRHSGSAGRRIALHLCEKLWRGFFRSWALYPLWDLIGQRLPLECCQMIAENLNNVDLWRVCSAAEGLDS